jgi:hypothetical protein
VAAAAQHQNVSSPDQMVAQVTLQKNKYSSTIGKSITTVIVVIDGKRNWGDKSNKVRV